MNIVLKRSIKYTSISLIFFILITYYYAFFNGVKCDYRSHFIFSTDYHVNLTCQRGKLSQLTYKYNSDGDIIFSGITTGRQFRIGSHVLLFQYDSEVISSKSDDLALEFINSEPYNLFFVRMLTDDDSIFVFQHAIGQKKYLLLKGSFSGTL